MSSIFKLLVVVGVLVWMQDRDMEHAREHAAEVDALVQVVSTQADIIDGLGTCAPVIPMGMPI